MAEAAHPWLDTDGSFFAGEIPTTVINDSAIFAMMVRVNKVIPMPRRDGEWGFNRKRRNARGVRCGKLYEVPVVCVTGLYKLSPLYPYDQDTFNVQLSQAVYFHLRTLMRQTRSIAVNPRFDYIPQNWSICTLQTLASCQAWEVAATNHLTYTVYWMNIIAQKIMLCKNRW